MALMDEAVQAVVDAAGWKKPESSRDGACHFHLKGDLDFSLFSPDGRTCIMRGTVAELPSDNMQRDDLLKDVSKRQVAVCRKRPSVLTVEQAGQSLMASDDGKDKLLLFRQIRLEAGQYEAVKIAVKEFLNDLAWWKASLGTRQNSSASFFSMQSMFPGGGF